MSASIFQFQILTGPHLLEDSDCPLKDLIHAGGSLHLSLALSSLCTRGRELAHFAYSVGFFLDIFICLSVPSIYYWFPLYIEKPSSFPTENEASLLQLGSQYAALGTNVTSFMLYFSDYIPSYVSRCHELLFYLKPLGLKSLGKWMLHIVL